MKIEKPLKASFGEVQPAGGRANPTLNGEQFMGGAQEAKTRYRVAQGMNPDSSNHGWGQPVAESEQQPLFSKESVARPEAHQQTPSQFASDDRNWWHGRYTERLPKEGNTGEGFHAGTRSSAQVRLEKNFGRRTKYRKAGGEEVPQEGRLFPMRLTKPVTQEYSESTDISTLKENRIPLPGGSPEHPRGDENKHKQLGPYGTGGGWGASSVKRNAYYYQNDIEDPGHISLGVSSRQKYLSTQKEMVKGAKAKGEYVHPLIDWAVKKSPEHTGEDAVVHKRNRFVPEGPRQEWAFDAGAYREQNHGVVRASFEQANGRMQRVWRDRRTTGPQPGSANEPKAWFSER